MNKLLDTEILNLKVKGKSLRKIAASLGVSHTTVMRRLRGMEQVSLPGIVTDKGTCHTPQNPYPSRDCGESWNTANQVSTPKTPSLPLHESINPSENHSRGPLPGMKGVFQGVDSESGDLFEGIKDFLESNGIEVYKMQVGQEAYQVKCGDQTITFYVKRKIMECPMSPGAGERWVK